MKILYLFFLALVIIAFKVTSREIPGQISPDPGLRHGHAYDLPAGTLLFESDVVAAENPPHHERGGSTKNLH